MKAPVKLEASGSHLSGHVAHVDSRSGAFRTTRIAARLRSAAAEAGVELTTSYAAIVAADGLARCGQLGITRLGEGVVIHTAPEDRSELPIVLGYADRGGEWLRDGSCHQPDEAMNR